MVNKIKTIRNEIVKQDSGVTLIELLASIFLLSIIITGFLSFFLQAAKTNNRIDEMNEATFIAQEHLEIMNALAEENSFSQTRRKYSEEDTSLNNSDFDIAYIFEGAENPHTVVVTVSKRGEELAKMESRISFSEAGENE